MKKNRSYIIGAWLLLVFFAGGQVILFAHQHHVNQAGLSRHGQLNQPTLTGKCSLCDTMHFNTMVADENAPVVHLPVAAHYDYQAVTCTFISFSLVLSPGRAPPVS